MAVSANFHELPDFDSDDDVIAKALDEDWDWCKSEFIGNDVTEISFYSFFVLRQVTYV